MRDDLANLPGLYAECESALTRFQVALDERVRVRGGQRRDLCLNDAVVDARLRMRSVLATWAGRVANKRRVARLARGDVPELVTFLLDHYDWLLAHPVGPEFAAEVTAIADTARRVCRPGPHLRLELGRCPRDGCAEVMFAAAPGQGAPSSAHVRCGGGHVWRPHEWLLLARHIRERDGEPARATAG